MMPPTPKAAPCQFLVAAAAAEFGLGGLGGVGGISIGGVVPIKRTTGTNMEFERQPECDREANFMASQIFYMTQMDGPSGSMIPLTVTDPYYQDPGWTKWEVAIIQHETNASVPKGYYRQYKIVMHYMYNVTTRQIFQTKLKNSWQYGCEGFVKPN
jgi:hypothetical protein